MTVALIEHSAAPGTASALSKKRLPNIATQPATKPTNVYKTEEAPRLAGGVDPGTGICGVFMSCT
jgi:hypothetical protein